MPSLSNEAVQLSDILYDLSNGRGTAVALTEESIEVLFDNGRRITFNAYGQLDGVRRLFWQYPVIIDPPKSLPKWEKIVNVITAVYRLTNHQD